MESWSVVLACGIGVMWSQILEWQKYLLLGLLDCVFYEVESWEWSIAVESDLGVAKVLALSS